MVESSTLDANTLIRQARKLQNGGSAQEAYQLYTQLNEADPQNALGWIGRSETADDVDEQLVSLAYAIALDETNRALADLLRQRLDGWLKNAKREDAPRVFEIGRELALVGLRHAAGEILQRVTELDPAHLEAWLWRAGIAASHGEAQTCLGVAQALAPNDSTVQAALEWLEGVPYIPALPVAVPAPPTAPPVETPAVYPTPAAEPDSRAAELEKALQLAEQLLVAGDKPGAYAQFVHATDIDPRNEQAWIGRARATNDTDQALASLDAALNINPENTATREARNFLRRQKLRETQGAPERLEMAQAPRVSTRTPEAVTPTGRRSPLLFVLIILILLAFLAVLTLWYFNFLRLF